MAAAVAGAATEEVDRPGVRRWGLLPMRKKAEVAQWGGGDRVLTSVWGTFRCRYCESAAVAAAILLLVQYYCCWYYCCCCCCCTVVLASKTHLRQTMSITTTPALCLIHTGVRCLRTYYYCYCCYRCYCIPGAYNSIIP